MAGQGQIKCTPNAHGVVPWPSATLELQPDYARLLGRLPLQFSVSLCMCFLIHPRSAHHTTSPLWIKCIQILLHIVAKQTGQCASDRANR